jgi:catechol 2,3-dioxygenase-like lactoylglutathione lyase family enzyme
MNRIVSGNAMEEMPMSAFWGRTTVLVRDEEEALDFYTRGFGFETIFDSGPVSADNPTRFLHIGSIQGNHATGLWLIKAEAAQQHLVGGQTGGQPLGVVYVDNLEDALIRLAMVGALPSGARGSDATSRFAHVPDLYGNDIVVVQLLH